MSKEIDNGIDDDIDTNTDDINISDDKMYQMTMIYQILKNRYLVKKA